MKKSESGTKNTLFDVIGLIHSKDHYPDSYEMNEYVAFLANNAMSQNQDLIFHAQAMNENWGIPKEANFAFYYYSVPKKKRFAKWAKRDGTEDEKIKLLKECYDYSSLKAREVIPLMDDLNLWDSLKKELNKGGVGKVSKNELSRACK